MPNSIHNIATLLILEENNRLERLVMSLSERFAKYQLAVTAAFVRANDRIAKLEAQAGTGSSVPDPDHTATDDDLISLDNATAAAEQAFQPVAPSA